MLGYTTAQNIYLQIPYKQYSVQLNCTYSTYTEAGATYSGEQKHGKFNVQILYKILKSATKRYLE